MHIRNHPEGQLKIDFSLGIHIFESLLVSEFMLKYATEVSTNIPFLWGYHLGGPCKVSSICLLSSS